MRLAPICRIAVRAAVPACLTAVVFAQVVAQAEAHVTGREILTVDSVPTGPRSGPLPAEPFGPYE